MNTRPFASSKRGSRAPVMPPSRVAATSGRPNHPTAWISMSRQLGAGEAARRLVITGDIQTGFDRLTNWPASS